MTTSRRSLALRAAAPVAFLLVSLSAPGLARAGGDPQRPWRDHDAEATAAIRAAETRSLDKLAGGVETGPDTSGYDVKKYTISYDVDFGSRTISARTRVDAVATAEGLATVDLDFVGFSISELTVDGASGSYARVGGARVLRVALPRALAPGQPFAIEVAYAGQPTIEGGLGFGFTQSGAATFAEPEGARLWYPCKDRPSDKAQYEGFVTVPSSYVVASNGRLVGTTAAGQGRTTYHWLETHQICTYLIDFAVSDYRVIEDSLGDLPVRHYVYPRLESAARTDLSRTPEMIATFQERLGVPYPFDKYGHALFENFGGAMEHQSCTSYGAGLITGDNRYDLVVAHELGHQWFGDLVSPSDWREIWLNEGFATWTEYLWIEHFDPDYLPQLKADRERQFDDYEDRVGAYALYAPPASRLFGTTIYEKGGWVVAMLRDQIGDDAFFAGMRSYLEGHAYGNATTEDFRAAMEAASGRDLSAFFAEWVYGVGHPQYQTAWTARIVPGGHYQLDLRVRQIQSTATVFTTPLEVEAVSADGARVREVVAVTSADAVATVCLDFDPVRVTFDPDNRVLGPVYASGEAVPSQPAVCAEDAPDVEIASVGWVAPGALRVTGTGFVVGDSVVEVDGVALARTKYPKGSRNPDGTTTLLVGKQKRLRDLVPAGTPVRITVLNRSTGERSAPMTFTR
jgi:aminopeptidase N